MSIPLRRSVFAAALLGAGTAALAQAPAAGALSEVTVTGAPTGAADTLAPPASAVSGTGLLLRQQSSLGETLSGLPGVSSTYFGPTASRPVVRGLDGDRVRVVQSGGASVDVSNLSYDHAVTADPITVEGVEVLRGPAALRYGGNALGGVVNLIDNRIPREPIGGATGRADAGYASGNRERSAAAVVDGGGERFGLHVDAFDRRAGDTRVPVALPCLRGGQAQLAQRICNSQADTRGGAVGGSLFFDQGYLGASVARFRTDYGSVAEDDVTLDMASTRYALEGEVRRLPGWFHAVKAQASHTDYRHTEFEAGVPGTVFANRGDELRIEARQARLGALDGLVGLQTEQSRFSATGEEAFAPPSRTRRQALFVQEELATGWGKLSAGLRREWTDVAAQPDGSDRFAAAERRFGAGSAALGATWNLAPAWQLSGSLARSQRAPRDAELFANGPHIATAAWEVGNPALGVETSTGVDLGLQWKSGHHRARLGAFHNRFSDYIALLPTGASRDASVGPLPEYAYRGVAARIRGLEAEGSQRLLQAAGTLDLEWRGDLVRADNLTLGEPLPRIAPLRVGATLVWAQGAWGARFGADRWARQTRVPAGAAVDGYTLVSAALTYRVNAWPGSLLWYARVDNATDRLAYSASSFLTQSLPGRVPLPGRSLKVGLRADF